MIMKNLVKWFGIIALAAVIRLSFAACGGDGGEPAGSTEPPETAMYSGVAEDGSKYTLKVIEKTGRYAAQDGGSYIMYQVKDGETKTSSDTVTKRG
jgi:predicted small lipoprotein YifL